MSKPMATVSPPGVRRPIKVGLVTAFTGCYDSVTILRRFLQHAGFQVITSRISTAPIVEAGTAVTSADFCFPLRVYVGHVQALAQRHPDLDAILAPNVWTDKMGSTTCCKYRDIGGVAIRSLWGMIPYLAARRGQTPTPAPRLIRPDIQSFSYPVLRNAAFEIYAELLGLPRRTRLAFLLPRQAQRWAKHLTHVEQAFARAWDEVASRPLPDPAHLLSDAKRPRLALVGRRYLVEDPILTADLKPWFKRRGVTVLTAWDLPEQELAPHYHTAEGFYDTHREAEAFVNWAMEKVDGFIVLGSFGCHPDAFQVDYLADKIRSGGKPAWAFRFDENAGTTGFLTRFETILGFLESLREQRLNPTAGASVHPGAEAAGASHPEPGRDPAESAPPMTPLLVWPYLGEELNIALEELLVQAGLQEFAHPPSPIDGSTLELGNRRYSETCSPYACATGSLMQTVQSAVRRLREEAAERGETAPRPRRILALMLQGEGPCTFGWYALAHKRHLASDLAGDLSDGHTFQLLTMGMENPVAFLRQLVQLGSAARLSPILRYVEDRADGTWQRLSPFGRLDRYVRLLQALRLMIRPAWSKLLAAERLRARSLLVRAHELTPGSTTEAYRECLRLLRQAHEVPAIRRALRQGLSRLDALPRDRQPTPRVVSVGEIYVTLTSFANRGVIEKLLGREGIEVVEGVSLSGFIYRTFLEFRRRQLAELPLVKPLRSWLERRNIRLLGSRPYGIAARPWLESEIGGEGMEGVAAARITVEKGCDGIVHTLPFKCMPEGLARDAYREISEYYGVRYLTLSFDKELDLERVKTEVTTFATLLRLQTEERPGSLVRLWERLRRHLLGHRLNRLYDAARRPVRPGSSQSRILTIQKIVDRSQPRSKGT